MTRLLTIDMIVKRY